MTTEEVYQQLANEYIATLENRDVPHGRVFLIFSGVPASGKTTLAQRLRDDLKAQYVRHDDIRERIRRDGLDPAHFVIAKISSHVIDTVMEHDANKFVIIDASLDRTWPRFFEHANEHHAKTIVIRLDIPRDSITKRLDDRPEGHAGKRGIEMYYQQFENSKKHVAADITLGADYDYKGVLRQVKALL